MPGAAATTDAAKTKQISPSTKTLATWWTRACASGCAAEGKCNTKALIGNTGSVQLSTVTQSSLGPPPTEACIAEAFKDWQFPAPKCGGLVIFNYPLELHPNPRHAPRELASRL